MNVLTQVVVASVLAGFASMAIAFFGTSRLSKVWLRRLVAFAAGLMLALALLDLMPEAIEGGLAPDNLFQVLLIVLMALFAFDHQLHAGHRHASDGACAHHLERPIPLILAGGAMHVFTDGLVLGAAFLADPVLAWTMAFAILAHEVPREAGDFAVLLTARWERNKALKWNAVTRVACVIGAILGYLVLSGVPGWLPYVLAIAAANFIYIALTAILPWLRHERETFAWQGGFMVAGAALVHLAVRFLH